MNIDVGFAGSICSIAFLIFLNAFFAAKEIAFVSLSESKIDLEIKKGVRKALNAKKIKKNQNYFLTIIQIMIHILTLLQGFALSHLIKSKIPDCLNNHFGFIFIEVVVMILSMVLGEIIPKRIALTYPLKTAYFVNGFFNILFKLLKPIFWLLDRISNLILFILRINLKNQKDNIVEEEELRYIISSSINNNENNMIQNVFDFHDTVISDIMRHRKEIIAVDSSVSKEQLISLILNEKYTRFPVYENNIDKIIGIVHIKDIFKNLLEENKNQLSPDISYQSLQKNDKIVSILEHTSIPTASPKDYVFDIKKFLRKPYYVSECKKISEVFKEMQSTRNHVAIVVDEYGGTAGIVTIEDVIEEILGDIKDEYDTVTNIEILKISDQEYIIKGTEHLHEIEEYLKAGLPVESYDTLSGFMLGQLKRIPEKNEKVEIIYKNWKFYGIADPNGLVITKVKATRLEPSLYFKKEQEE